MVGLNFAKLLESEVGDNGQWTDWTDWTVGIKVFILDILHNLNSLPRARAPALALLALFLSRENGSKTTLIGQGQGHGQGIDQQVQCPLSPDDFMHQLIVMRSSTSARRSNIWIRNFKSGSS